MEKGIHFRGKDIALAQLDHIMAGQNLANFCQFFLFFKVHSHSELIDLSTHPILWDGTKENHYISTLVCNTHCGYIRST